MRRYLSILVLSSGLMTYPHASFSADFPLLRDLREINRLGEISLDAEEDFETFKATDPEYLRLQEDCEYAQEVYYSAENRASLVRGRLLSVRSKYLNATMTLHDTTKDPEYLSLQEEFNSLRAECEQLNKAENEAFGAKQAADKALEEFKKTVYREASKKADDTCFHHMFAARAWELRLVCERLSAEIERFERGSLEYQTLKDALNQVQRGEGDVSAAEKAMDDFAQRTSLGLLRSTLQRYREHMLNCLRIAPEGFMRDLEDSSEGDTSGLGDPSEGDI